MKYLYMEGNSISKENLTLYLISEIDYLEPKNKYYYDYYCLFTNISIDKNPNTNYKELFLDLLNESKLDYLIHFMKNTMFLPENSSNDEIIKILEKFNIENNKKVVCNKKSFIIDDYVETQSNRNNIDNKKENINLIPINCSIN